MNTAEETNLRAEVVVLREMIKYLIAQLPDDAATTEALEAAAKRVVDTAPPLTHERVALQRAVNQIAPLSIKRRLGPSAVENVEN
jgi:Tfp pilus assembly protein PilO